MHFLKGMRTERFRFQTKVSPCYPLLLLTLAKTLHTRSLLGLRGSRSYQASVILFRSSSALFFAILNVF